MPDAVAKLHPSAPVMPMRLAMPVSPAASVEKHDGLLLHAKLPVHTPLVHLVCPDQKRPVPHLVWQMKPLTSCCVHDAGTARAPLTGVSEPARHGGPPSATVRSRRTWTVALMRHGEFTGIVAGSRFWSVPVVHTS